MIVRIAAGGDCEVGKEDGEEWKGGRREGGNKRGRSSR